MRHTRFIQAVALVLGLAIWLTGCGSGAKSPEPGAVPAAGGKGEQTAPVSTGGQSGSSPSAGQNTTGGQTTTPALAPGLPEIAGEMAILRAAMGEPSPLTYKISIADAPKGADKNAYLDQMLASMGGYPGKNEVLLLLFPEDNYDIRFAMGSFLFEKKVSVESMLNMVRSHYLTKARTGDPAGGLADLIRAANQQVK